MQTKVLQSLTTVSTTLSLKSSIGQITQIRNHVKMYPWRFNRQAPDCHLDNIRTPYTDRFNMNEFKSSKKKKKPWMQVIPKEKDHRFYRYKLHEAYKSDPVEAKETASSRLARFQDSLRDRGAARESKPYDPPTDVRERIFAIFKRQNNIRLNEEEMLNFDLNQNREVKFNLLSSCIDEFGHDLSNSWLNDIERISDLMEYYSTPVRGINPYTALVNKSDELPENLTIIPEPERYDRENDDQFGGYNALPGIISTVPGLRASKKYRVLNQDEFQWPDI